MYIFLYGRPEYQILYFQQVTAKKSIFVALGKASAVCLNDTLPHLTHAPQPLNPSKYHQYYQPLTTCIKFFYVNGTFSALMEQGPQQK